MKALFERKKLGADLFAFFAQDPGVRARQLERGLDGFAAGVAKIGAIHAGDPRDAFGQAGHLVVEVVVRRVDQRAALLSDCLLNHLVAIAQRVDADAAEQIEIAVAVLIDQMNVFAGDKQNRKAIVGVDQEPRFGGLNLF